jgi:AraC-like DNA-binding protein/mannose-6-phosphate isomerase-like protein (cupin superfamily)
MPRATPAKPARPLSLTATSLPTRNVPVLVFAERQVEATQFPPHHHGDQLQMICAARGTIHVATESALLLAPAGRAVLIPCGLTHAVHVPLGAAVRVAAIYPPALGERGKSCRVVNLSPLAQTLIETAAAYPLDQPLSPPQSRIIRVLLDELRAAPNEPFHLPRPRDLRARAVADGLVAEPGNRVTLHEWGRRVGASRRTLARLFERETGMSFGAYRRLVQLGSAIGLLAGGASVTMVALDLGYESTSAFVYMFRRALQTTPRRYARAASPPLAAPARQG